MEKGIKNADTIACKLGLALIRVINDRLDVVREERQKKEEMMKRRKAEAMVAKRRRTRGRISLSSEEEDKSNTRDNTDLDQANPNQTIDKYPVDL